MKTLSKGIDREKVELISKLKNEPDWMTKFRLDSYDVFKLKKMPSWGPNININLDDITYYKKVFDDIKDNWDNLEKGVKKILEGDK